MNQSLSNLKDIHLPPAVSSWPPAPGWYMLALLLALGLCGLVYGIWRYWQRYRRRRLTLKHLAHIADSFGAVRPAIVVRAYSRLLRRCVLAVFPRQEVAGLQGDAWLSFLDKTGQTRDFTQGAGRVLVAAPYQIKPRFENDALHATIKYWIKKNL